MASSSRSSPPDRCSGGRWPAFAQRSESRPEHARNAVTNVSLGSRPVSIEFVCSSTRAGELSSQLRASTKKRTIALSAAVSTPLPATSPTSTATSPPGSRQTP